MVLDDHGAVPQSAYDWGYAASREQAMADFKARWAVHDPQPHARQRRAHAGRVGAPSMRSRPRVAAHLVSLVHGAVYNELVWRPRRQKNMFRSRPYGRPTREAIARQ
jgi:hypothetical protein